jgi:hypothetical protein
MNYYLNGAPCVELLLGAFDTLLLTFSCMYFILMVLELIPVALGVFIFCWGGDSEDDDEVCCLGC